ncbi:MAG: hypothetical protein ACI86C_001844, partial [Candidatus Latescibacterota bacterium]
SPGGPTKKAPFGVFFFAHLGEKSIPMTQHSGGFREAQVGPLNNQGVTTFKSCNPFFIARFLQANGTDVVIFCHILTRSFKFGGGLSLEVGLSYFVSHLFCSVGKVCGLSPNINYSKMGI